MIRAVFLRLVLTLSVLLAAACGGPQTPVLAPEALDREIGAKVAAAFRSEALDAPETAARRWLDVLDRAREGESAIQVAAARAAVDALVVRDIPSLRSVTSRAALAYRIAKTGGKADGAIDVDEALARVAERTASGVVRSTVLSGLEVLAEGRGDAVRAARARVARGCALSVAVLGPLDWAPLSSFRAPTKLDAFDAPMPESFTTPGPFGRRLAPTIVGDRGCDLDIMAPTAETGLRQVVVDVTVPRAQTIGLELRAKSAARLVVGGKEALVRAYELGDHLLARVASAEVEAGRLRVVVTVAGEEPGTYIGLAVWDEDGKPLPFAAPAGNDRGTARAQRVSEIRDPDPRSNDERLTLALGAMARRDHRVAERWLASAFKADPQPDLGLAYARSLDGATDVPQIQRAERARSAVAKVLERWPTSWEAVLLSATLGAVRRGEGEAQIEALRETADRRAKGATSSMLDAFDAAWATNANLHDRAEVALAQFEAKHRGTILAAELGAFVKRMPLADRAKVVCTSKDLDRTSLDCYSALRTLGDHEGAKRELERIRGIVGAPRLYTPLAIRDALHAGDRGGAAKEYALALPGERSMFATFVLEPQASTEAGRKRLADTLVSSREAAGSLGPLLAATGDDRLKQFEGVAERVVAEDRKKRVMPEAATVVLSHTERYSIEPSGLLHAVLHDVRRVGGTTDVEQNAQADAPNFLGRSSLRAVVRRILKADGRVLLPDRTPGAAQSHADLSQLGPGDVVEALYEAWTLPNETFDIGFDTPDLLPDRTAVADASFEIRLPASLAVSMRAHPMLGRATERTDGGTKVMSWAVRDRPARRFEDGVPKMDRSVGVTLTTVTWKQISRALGETLRGLDETDPEVASWARTAGRGLAPSQELVAAIVTAAGEALRQPGGALLADYGVGRAGARQTMTARTFLAEREGSRTWLVARALRELGVPTEVLVAEQEPYSADPEFPARFGRFVHPLLIARVPVPLPAPHATVKNMMGTLDLIVDADVQGPPLPPGRFSPELRGRKALHADGRITTLPTTESTERDELDLRLVLDKKGDARGSFTAVLRGRSAQELADAFTRIVGDERQRALRNVVLGYVPGANVDLVVLSSSEGSWQIALRADISVSGFAQAEKSKKGDVTWVIPGLDPIHYVYPRPFVTSLVSAYASQGARQNALAIGRAVQYHLHRRIELPAGSRVVRAPGPLRLEGPLLSAERTLGGSATSLEDDFVLGVRTGTVAREDYGKFVDSTRRVDESFLSSTRLSF